MYNYNSLLNYIRMNVDEREIERAWGLIDKERCPLSHVDNNLYDKIVDLIDGYWVDNNLSYDERPITNDVFEDL